LKKNRLLLFPFFVGLALMIYSWFVSYPLIVNSVNDRYFNHISPLYWFSLPLLLTSMLMIALTSKSTYLKWIMALGFLFTIYSIGYFYFPFPIGDSQYVRGLNEFFAQTKNLYLDNSYKIYFQWPGSFIFTYVAASVTGIQVSNFDYLGYAVLGFLLATTTFVYASKFSKTGGILLLAVFFVGMYYFLDFQYEAFTIAFCPLLLLLMLDQQKRTSGTTLAMIVLFVFMTFTHLFVPVFFLLYLLTRTIISKSKHYGFIFVMYSSFYFLLETTISKGGFSHYVRAISHLQAGVSGLSDTNLAVKPAYFPFDAIAQIFSTTVLIMVVVLCSACFLVLFLKRKLRDLDKAMILSGIIYSVLGPLVFLLGYRAAPLIFLPICLGVVYIFSTFPRTKPFLIGLILILLVLFTFIPIHLSFSTQYTVYQTKEGYFADNFFVKHYELSNRGLVLANFFTSNYLENRIVGPHNFTIDSRQLKQIEMVIYNLALQHDLGGNDTVQTFSKSNSLDIVYDNGFSRILIKNNNSAT
jgi:hypothetical protein